MDYRKIIEERLSEEDKAILKSIYAPEVVAVPNEDACLGMCVTSGGEIRIYGTRGKKEPDDVGTPGYIASLDGGLSWKFHYHKAEALGAAGFNPNSGRYISFYPALYRKDFNRAFKRDGVWAVLNDEGYDGTNHRFVKLSDRKGEFTLRQPMYIESCNRWLILVQYPYPDFSNAVVIVYYSDDDGESWSESILKSAPPFEIKKPHKSTRWQQYSCEPTVVELSDGKLVMIVRTAQDFHYYSVSEDKGASWTDPKPTVFHGTITQPVLHKLSDGRIVFFWCNTQPMPEIDKSNVFPPLDDDEKNGIWEDVFTNRDVNHLAISDDDMKTWTGFRELYLNNLRNNADFRSIGGVDSRDKSVHQAQMLELPYNKLLVQFGQNEMVRKAVILDIDWLYEKDREENFRYGLGDVSTHMYVKSNLGCYRGFSGHCAYNRTNGAMLMPDPSGNHKEVLQICRVEDERLAYKKQGVVWNFPSSSKGRVEAELCTVGSGVRVCLTDRWYNPCDETVAEEAAVRVLFDEKCDWTKLVIEYDTELGVFTVSKNGENKKLNFFADAPCGLSYLHIQTLAEEEDFEGTLIRSMKKTAL